MTFLLFLFLNYYVNCQGLSDAALKQALGDTISKGVRYEYGPNQYHSGWDPAHPKGEFKAYGTWQAFPGSDCRDDGTIWDMYSNSVRYFPHKRGESACSIQIEHCLPKSWWGWTTGTPTVIDSTAYKDLFNLNPADAQANGQKSNYAPGKVEKANKFDNGVFRMCKADSKKGTPIYFEPADEYKGDFARTYLYMVTAYANASWPTTDTANINPSRYTMLSNRMQDLLLEWHRQDPVSDKEIHRASVITSIQKNHNPFIDYPDLVEYIWGTKQGQAVDFDLLTCTYDSTYVPPVFPRPHTDVYDTIINLSGINTDALKELADCESYKLSANGTQAVTMGSSSNDGYVQFTNLHFTDSAWLVIRAGIYNTADYMRLDIIADGQTIKTIADTTHSYTRNEKLYWIALPIATTTVKVLSVGGSTTKRACLQELYILQKNTATSISAPATKRSFKKVLSQQQIYINAYDATYTILGQQVSE